METAEATDSRRLLAFVTRILILTSDAPEYRRLHRWARAWQKEIRRTGTLAGYETLLKLLHRWRERAQRDGIDIAPISRALDDLEAVLVALNHL
jgi:hypothetical protein